MNEIRGDQVDQPEPFLELDEGDELSEVSTLAPSENIPKQVQEEKKEIFFIRDKFNYLLYNFDNSFSYRIPRSASDEGSERSRRSNAPTVSAPSGYSAEPGSTESISQKSSNGSEQVYDPYSVPTQAGPEKRKKVDIMDLEGDAVQQELVNIFGRVPQIEEASIIPLSQNRVLIRDINENIDEIKKFIRDGLTLKQQLDNAKIRKIRKIVDELSGTFTRFLNNEPLSQINDDTLSAIYNNNPDIVDNAYEIKRRLYLKMKVYATNFNDIANAAAAAGSKRITKKQLSNILKNKTTKSNSAIKQLDTEIFKILNS
jgi:hypothetical protein